MPTVTPATIEGELGAGPRLSRSRSLSSLADAVGRTPLLRLHRLEAQEDLVAAGVELYAKLEFFNPGGSVKDRPALRMVREALAAGRLRPGVRLLDSTSGNTGAAYAWIGAALGLPITLVMPENVSSARKAITEAYGAEVIYTDSLEGSDGAIREARALVARYPDRYCYLDQYSNPANPMAHFEGTGPEIWGGTQGRITHFVAGIGTSGTLIGTGRRLQQENASVRVIGVQPTESFHGLEGLKHLASSLVPAIFQSAVPDEMLFIETDEGWDVADRLARVEGALVGHSSGAAMAGALKVARSLRERGEAGVVVTLFPDKAERYIEAPVRPARLPPLRRTDPAASQTGALGLTMSTPFYEPTVMRALVAEAQARYPLEACGLVFEGPTGVRVQPMENALDRYHARDPKRFPRTAATGYLLDPRQQLDALEQAAARGERLAAIFHSHIEVGAYFSAEDRALALTEDGIPLLPQVEYVVLSVRAQVCDEIKGYLFEAGGLCLERDLTLPGLPIHGA